MKPMELYLKAMIEPLLFEPKALNIVMANDELGTLFTVSVAKKDMGMVIGKSGETVKAIRTIMHNLGSKNRMKVSVKINEPII